MKRLSIQSSLIAILSLILSISLLTATVSSLGLAGTNGATKEIATNWLPSVAVVNAINTATGDYRIAQGSHVMSTSADEMTRAESDIKAKGDLVVSLRKQYEPLISSKEEQATYEKFAAKWSDYLKMGSRLLALSRANENEQAGAFFKADMRKAYDDVGELLDKLVSINNEGAKTSYASSQDAYTRTSLATYGMTGLLIVILIGSVVFVVAQVTRPIQRITKSMGHLAQGDKASEIPYGGRADEIGHMAAAVETFRQNAIRNDRLEEEAAAGRNAAEHGRVAEEKRLAEEAERLRIATTTLGDNLRRLADGDLTCSITTKFAQEYETLRADFNATVDQLSKTIGAVNIAVYNMDNGTREIASGANDLSKRTEQQAAALEETAAALDQITSNVSSSSKTTAEARGVAEAANQSAAHSAKVVSSAERAMQRIEESSQKISNIISVIDEIAFQTNLLALNAGVEAARAGEAGKGFAVVAQEVRELAQRSAQAAKEIKELIHNSTTEVESGVQLVRDTGVALKSIGGYIAEINTHMQDIATSAQEQSTGLSQVNVAVNQMDQTTQQNAAMVEESTAAAAALSQEAAKLRDLVSQFKVDATFGQQATALRQAARSMAASATMLHNSPRAARAKQVAYIGGASGGNWEEF